MAEVPESKQPGGPERQRRRQNAIGLALLVIVVVAAIVIWVIKEQEDELLVTPAGGAGGVELSDGDRVLVSGTVERFTLRDENPGLAEFEEQNRIVATRVESVGEDEEIETGGLVVPDIAGENVATFAGDEVTVVGEVEDVGLGDGAFTIVED